MAREYLWLVQESAFGTAVASPTAGTQSIYIRLDEGNAFTVRPNPKIWEIMHGGGLAIAALRGSSVTIVGGQLKCKLCYSQALFLLGWALTRINSGQTSPWVTTEPAGDLASVSCYHAIQRSDGTYKKRLYTGCKVAKLTLASTSDSQLWDLTLDILGGEEKGNTVDSSSDPTFSAPAESAYASDPANFTHASGGLSINAVTRTFFGELSLEVTNSADARSYAGAWVEIIRILGRMSVLSGKNLYQATPDDRSAYELQTALAASLALTNGTHTITISLCGQNMFDGVDDDLPVDKIYEQGFKLKNLWDPTALSGAGNDLALTVS